MIIYDSELLYSNALESDGHGAINELLVVLNNPYLQGDNSVVTKSIEEDAPELERDLPLQTIEFTFVGNMGFALRIDNEYNKMEVIRIKPDGQAMEVGLHHGDMSLRVNEENVSKSPEIAFPLLKECVESGQPFVVTFLRKMYDKLVVMVTRAGTSEANGKYLFESLDDQDAPIFVQSQDKNWVLARLDYDDETGESIWSLQKNGNDYYIGLSPDYSPPNGGWECVKPTKDDKVDPNYKGGQMPAPGLTYFIKTIPMVK